MCVNHLDYLNYHAQFVCVDQSMGFHGFSTTTNVTWLDFVALVQKARNCLLTATQEVRKYQILSVPDRLLARRHLD